VNAAAVKASTGRSLPRWSEVERQVGDLAQVTAAAVEAGALRAAMSSTKSARRWRSPWRSGRRVRTAVVAAVDLDTAVVPCARVELALHVFAIGAHRLDGACAST
jgi:hypothetical protein